MNYDYKFGGDYYKYFNDGYGIKQSIYKTLATEN